MSLEDKMCECLSNLIDCAILTYDFDKRLFILIEGPIDSNYYFTLVQLHSDDIVPMYGFDESYSDSYYHVEILATRCYDDIFAVYKAIVDCPLVKKK